MKYINLDNVCEFVRNGASIKQDSQCNEGIPITRIETISNDKFNFDRLGYANIKDDKYSDYYLKDKDVLLSHINSAKYLGRSVLYRKKDENPIIHGMNLLRLRFIKDKYLPDYFVYYSQSNVAKAYIQKHTKLAVNQASITSTAIKDMPIPMIEMGKQKEISKSLDKCNEIIHKHKQLLSKYDFLIKSRFIEMFGEPIENTKSWKEEPLGNCCLLKAGKAIKASELADKDKEHPYPCFGGNGIRGFISKKSHTGKIVLIGRQGALCGNVQLTDGDFYATEHAVVTTPKKELNSIWLYHLLFLMDLNRYKSGAAQPGLTVEKLNTVPTMIVPIKLQNDFAAFVQQIDKSKFEIWLYLNLCYIIEKRVFTYD